MSDELEHIIAAETFINIKLAADDRHYMSHRDWLFQQFPNARSDTIHTIIFAILDTHHHHIAIHIDENEVRITDQ